MGREDDSKIEGRTGADPAQAQSVLLVVASYLPNLGGLQRVTSRLAAELLRAGHRVSVLSQRYPRGLPAAEVMDGVRVRRLLFLIPRWGLLRAGRAGLFLAALFYFPLTSLRLLLLLAREKPGVVNLHFLGSPALFLLVARRLLKFHFVVSLHGDDVEGLPNRTWFDRWLFRTTLRRADAVTACSAYLLGLALSQEPTIGGKAAVVYNGAEPATAPAGGGAAPILSVGRMVPKKGFDVLLRAMSDYAQAFRGEGLTLIGDGPERSSLEALSRELELSRLVDFRGAAGEAEVASAMAASRLIVIPSRQEPFGVVALEAMAAGKPVVASRVGGLPEVLREADAVMVESDDPQALAEALMATRARLEREPDFGARNRAVAASFSVPRMVQSYLDVYRGCATHSGTK